jgi:hypothetical protein
VLPKYSVRPWRGNVAFAYQFGKRPLNPRFSYVEERAREPLRALDARRRRAEQEHARRLQALRQDASPDRHARLAHEEQDFAEQELVFRAERDAIRKAAWRELRAGVRRLWERRYYLLVGEVSFAGRVENAVGLESFSRSACSARARRSPSRRASASSQKSGRLTSRCASVATMNRRASRRPPRASTARSASTYACSTGTCFASGPRTISGS